MNTNKGKKYWKEFKNMLDGMGRLGQFALKVGPWITVGIISVTILIGTIPSLELWLLGKLVDELTQTVESSNAHSLWQLTPILMLIAFLSSIRLTGTFLNHLMRWSKTWFEEAMVYHIQSDVLTKANRIPLSHFESSLFHDKLSRANSGLGLTFSNLLFQLFKIIESYVMIIGLTILTFQVHWLIPLLIIGTGAPILLLQNKYNVDRYRLFSKNTKKQRLMNYFVHVLSGRAAAKEVRLFGLGPTVTARWKSLYTEVRNAVLKQNIRQRVKLGLVECVSPLTFAICLGLLLSSLMSGTASLGDVVMAFYAIIRMREQWEWCIRWMGWVHEDYLHFIRDLIGFLDLPEHARALQEGQDTNEGNKTRDERNKYDLINQPHSLTVNNVFFRYPYTESLVLNDVTFSLKPGEKVALLGENGSGKSTLVKLLLGLYEPDNGSITFSGHDIKMLNSDSLWRQVSGVFQDFSKYHLTLKENIGFGNISKLNEQLAIEKAARLGGAATIAESHKLRYERMLGATFGGSDLSGGQWQKVATARGFMREPQLLVLDEPTASLDPQAEVEVYKRFQEMAGSRTALLISHRIGFARLADRIIVLKNGRLVEMGTHHELLSEGGEYAKLLEIQAKWYQ